MGKLFDELKRRKVFRVAAVYTVVAWVLIQVADVVLPTFGAPAWVNQTLIFLFVIGFPLALVLAWAYETTPNGILPETGASSPGTAPAPQNQYLIYATFVLVLLVAGFQIADRFLAQSNTDVVDRVGSEGSSSNNVLRSSLMLDQPLIPRPWNPERTALEFNTDGSVLFYIDHERQSDGTLNEVLYSRNMASGETRLLADARWRPQISPDGNRLLMRDSIYSLQAGYLQIQLPISIAGADWLSDDEIIYVSQDLSIHRFSLVTGEDEALTPISGVARHGNPHGLPGGKAFIYSASNIRTDFSSATILAYDLISGEAKPLINGGYFASYVSSGHLLFIRDGDLYAAPFELDGLEVTGEEVRVVEGINSQPFGGRAEYAVSASGRLVYLPGTEQYPLQSGLKWVDRSGNAEDIPLPPGNYSDPELSPDGRSLAVTLTQDNGSSDIWLYDLERQTFGRRTFLERARNPKWSPDGTLLAFHVSDQGIWTVNADGTGDAEQLTDIPEARPESFVNSRDELLYLTGPIGSAVINLLSYRDGAWVSEPVINTDNNTWASKVSPDGRWIAYTSQETGRFEVFVQPYPNLSGGKWQISTQGGREPIWSLADDELFYLEIDGSLMSVPFTTEGAFEPGIPQEIAQDFFVYTADPPNYAAANDGQRFIQFPVTNPSPVDFAVEGNAVLTVVENWFEELNQLAPHSSGP